MIVEKLGIVVVKYGISTDAGIEVYYANLPLDMFTDPYTWLKRNKPPEERLEALYDLKYCTFQTAQAGYEFPICNCSLQRQDIILQD